MLMNITAENPQIRKSGNRLSGTEETDKSQKKQKANHNQPAIEIYDQRHCKQSHKDHVYI